MSNEIETLKRRVTQLEGEVASLRRTSARRGVRKRSSTVFFGLPLWEIAAGPDLQQGEAFGHAKAIIAIGDRATGAVAIGGMARGLIAIGGGAIGGLLAVGGGAIGGVALGGGALGGVAVGGGAVGYYAIGGGAKGKYVYSARRKDPEVAALAGRAFRLLKFLLR